MLFQIEEYAAGTASDPFFDCAAMPAEEMSDAQLAFVRKYFFQANESRLISRYPRYRELYDQKEIKAPRDIRDLQVLSQIAWFDEDVLSRDQEVADLILRGRDFSHADQDLVMRKQREALARVLPVYRDFATRGKIEISTTPFYHPILPLVCDSDIAAEARPEVTLPSRFCYPGDARVQLERARGYVREKLGVWPVGLWPSEGSVSDEALTLAYDCGFRWAATDNGVLSRTLQRDGGCDVTYQAYEWKQQGRAMRMLFRDHYLSDLIGFEYARWNPADAAANFLWRIRENTNGRDCVVPIILDGENAWEWYEANGRSFLRELYRRISEDPLFETATISEAHARYAPEPLHRIVPGSWINANFDIWIGAEEDNQAWERLLEARRFFEQHNAGVSESARTLAFEELLIAEGSDWCWWYGPEHGSDNRPEFDELYRDHLSNVYRALGHPPPANLSDPILRPQPGELHEPPTRHLQVTLDGEVSTPYEWLGAGRYRPDPRSGAMHGSTPVVREVLYGTDGTNLFVRIDAPPGEEYGIESETGPLEVRSARGRCLELESELPQGRFRVVRQRPGVPPEPIPSNGWLDPQPGLTVQS